MKEELKAVPDEVRATRRDVERKLRETEDEHPVVREAMDLRLLVVAAGIAIVLAFALRLAGLGFALSLVAFVVLLAGIWLGLARLAAPRRPTRPVRS